MKTLHRQFNMSLRDRKLIPQGLRGLRWNSQGPVPVPLTSQISTMSESSAASKMSQVIVSQSTSRPSSRPGSQSGAAVSIAAKFARSHSQFLRYAATSSIICCHVSPAFREPIMFFSASMRSSLRSYPTKDSPSTGSNLTMGQPTSSTCITAVYQLLSPSFDVS